MHKDDPAGEPRISYFNLEGSLVRAVCLFAISEPYEGIPRFGVGYAVAHQFRRQGLAKQILSVGIDEMRNGLKRTGKVPFYIEAVIDVANVGSQRVAEAIISTTRENRADDHSGCQIYAYRRLVE